MDAFELLERAGQVKPADPAVLDNAATALLARCAKTATGGAREFARPAAVPAPHRTRQRPILAVTAALAAAAAALAAVAVTSGPAASAPQVITVADLANRAAAAAVRQPDVRPGQWVYRKTINNGGDAPDVRAGTRESWATADDSQIAFFLRGKFIIMPSPQLSFTVSYSSLGSLPTDPRTLVTHLDHRFCPRQGPPSAGCPGYQNVFTGIAEMLQTYVMPPKITAELYRALAYIPGVRIEKNAVDIAGRHGIGLVYRLPNGTQEIIINSRTYTYMGSAFGYGRAHVPGRNNFGEALLRQAFVSGPGVRP